MALILEETAEELVYTDSTIGLMVVVKKDDSNLDVRQVVPIAAAGGQTWQTLRDYLATKLGA